ncbi:hypothetical protein HMI54_000231 [Coelomomyces lativittatus]|nr:hypothetical protein HMI56_007063 [Coelomomyces lativittatus]KAJ1512165.1 hypothetical protein HMI54_000231 [Coelomomyces lativittatus]KAJ1516040.1 hypothetical protein HMI55_003100 [Coelomomyces lativittatus]
MDILKLLLELQVASSILHSPFLRHLFKFFSPQTSPHLQQSLNSFHFTDEGDGLDFKAAYQQLSDFIFGWNVSELNTSENIQNDSNLNSLNSQTNPDAFLSINLKGNTSFAQPTPEVLKETSESNEKFPMLALHRVPRKINIHEQNEKAECLRILETFQAQYSMALRRLQRMCFSAEGHFNMVGKGIKHLFPMEQMNAFSEQEKDKEIWDFKLHPSLSKESNLSENDFNETKPDTYEETSTSSQEGEKRFAEESFNSNFLHPTVPMKSSKKSGSPPKSSRSRESEGSLTIPSIPGALSSSSKSLTPESQVKRKISVSPPNALKPTLLDPRKDEKNLNRKESISYVEQIHTPLTDSSLSIPTSPTSKRTSITVTTPFPQLPTTSIGSPSDPTHTSEKASSAAEDLMKQDLDFVFYDISATLDLLLSCLVCCVVILTFSELLRDKATYSKYFFQVYTLSHLFIQTPLKLITQAIQCLVSVPLSTWSYAYVHKLDTLHQHLQKVLQLRSYQSGNHPFFMAVSRLSAKLTLSHFLFQGFDIYMFPPLITAHKHGVKSVCATSFDEQVWMTGGYDGKIRIFDLSTKTCLAQYSGHRSIVTDVHFAKKDTYLVSCSFDKTLKIWNSQNATCEKTLTGHTESITSCAISPDGKYIVSVGLDLTLRLWDFFSGDCISITKKHGKYIKQVEFSHDGRYVLSAGLDRRIYVWDIKILAFSKNITHYRCIEAHDDAILAMDVCRPGYLITASRDHTLKLWLYLKGQCLYTLSLAPSWACCIKFSSDGSLFAAGCFDNSVHVFDAKLGTLVRVLKIFNLGILSLDFSLSKKFIVVGTSDGFVQKIDL